MPSRWPDTSRHERGYGASWVRLRKRILERDKYLCQVCLPRLTPATSVDHILAKAKGGTDEEGNLQSLCKTHRDAKDAADRGRPLLPEPDADGWPADW